MRLLTQIWKRPFSKIYWRNPCYQNSPLMKSHMEAKVQELYKTNEESFKAPKIVQAEITYFRYSHPNNRSGPAHANRNYSKFHVTAVCRDANGQFITKRHAYVNNMKK